MVLEAERRQQSGLRKAHDRKISNLADSAGSGDRACLEELIGIFHNEIFRMIYYRTGSRMDAEDLTQEVFFKMSKVLSKLDDPARFRQWLYRIAVNLVKDFHRKKKLLSFFSDAGAVEEMESIGTNPNLVRQMMDKEFWQQFHGLARKMSHMEREVFTLRYLDQLCIREIAGTMKKSESTVKTHLYRALEKFKGSPGLRALLRGNES